MLDAIEARRTTEKFGVSAEQVRRDHLMSHLLAALSRELADQIIFFGGTALARSHLPDGRLSEDLDLLAINRRADVVQQVERVLSEAVRREFGRLEWRPRLRDIPDTAPATLRSADGLTVRVQLLDPIGFPNWPTESAELIQRYSDAPAARLLVPTRAGFAASKTAAWHDRTAPRDLYDLWGLVFIGAIDECAAQCFIQEGPTGGPPRPWMFRTPPEMDAWVSELAAQTRIAVGPTEALSAVRDAWNNAIGDDLTNDNAILH